MMKTTYTYLLGWAILALLLPQGIYAQSLERQFLGSTGGFGSTSSAQVSSSVGEVVTANASTSAIILTQGFQQATDPSVGISMESVGMSVQAFPNPAAGLVTLEIDLEEPRQLSLHLTDLQGRRLMLPQPPFGLRGKMLHPIDMRDFAAGTYLLSIHGDRGEIHHRIKIQKLD